MTTISFEDRSFTPVMTGMALTFAVQKYSQRAVGGPYQAEVRVTGRWDDLATLLDWCRYGAKIYNDNGTLVWWGCVEKIEARNAGITMTANLEQMSNRIAVAYTTVAAGQSSVGERATTSWVQDATSIREFGIKELLDGIGGTTALYAGIARDRALADQRYPTGFAAIRPGTQSDDTSATLYLSGWWKTLSWRYAYVPALLALQYETIGAVEQTIGCDYNDDSLNVLHLAQSFDTSAALNLQEVEIYVKKFGAPADGLTVAICANPDDATPGTQLGTITIAASAISTSYAWVKATFSSPLALAAGTYFLNVGVGQVQGANASAYYAALLDGGQGYGAGALRKEVASAWSAGPAADMPFKLYSNALVETTQQAAALITSYGQFLKRVYVDNPSGIITESFRNGDSDAQWEVEELLKTGTSTTRRLLATVYPDRKVSIFAQPDGSEVYYLDKSRNFYNISERVEKSLCPVGFWARLRNVLPGGVNTGRISGLDKFFIEEMEYSVESKELTYQAFGDQNVYDWGVKDG